MGNTVRKYIALVVIVIALAISVFGVARAASGFNLGSFALLRDDSASTAESTETVEPTQAPELTETPEPTEVFDDHGQDAAGFDDHGQDGAQIDDNSQGQNSSGMDDMSTGVQQPASTAEVHHGGRGGSGSGGGGGSDDPGGHH